MIDWSKYPNFSAKEFSCKHCGKGCIQPELLETLQSIRTTLGKPLVISSGYRCPEHPAEKSKSNPGEHTKGWAVDIAIHGQQALDLIFTAQTFHVKRIGLNQKGDKSGRFVHIGIGDRYKDGFPVGTWTY